MDDAPHPMLARLWRHAAVAQGTRAQARAAQAQLAGLGTAVSALPLLADPLAALRASPWAPVGGQPAAGLDAALAALHQQALALARAAEPDDVADAADGVLGRAVAWPTAAGAAAPGRAAIPGARVLPGGMPAAAPGAADARHAGLPAAAPRPADSPGRAPLAAGGPPATPGSATAQRPGRAATQGSDDARQAWHQRLARSALEAAPGQRLPPAGRRSGPAAAAGIGAALPAPRAAPEGPVAAVQTGLARLGSLADTLAGGLAAALPALATGDGSRTAARHGTTGATAGTGTAGTWRTGPGTGPAAAEPAPRLPANADAWQSAGAAAGAPHAGAGAAAAAWSGPAAVDRPVAPAGSLAFALAGGNGGPGGFRGLAARAAGGAGASAPGLPPDSVPAPAAAAADPGAAGPAPSDDALLEQLARALRREAERDGIDLGGQRA